MDTGHRTRDNGLMAEYQILLLPRADYWTWVDSAKDYVLRFGASLTADPDSAGRYMTPQQTITVAGKKDGYPLQGDIQAWLRKYYPSLRLDYVPAESPAEFKAALAARIKANDRYLRADVEFKLLWPTDYPKVTQPFGVNPDVYRRWGLPGHEGIDFRAPRGANIYACADGAVVRVDAYEGNPDTEPYGNSLRLQHRDGYLTVYAHLLEVRVNLGDAVKAGQVIGLADSTGNSAGDHLHLTLKKAGATAAGLTNYPRDIIDPTPFLIWPAEATPGQDTATQPPPAIQYPWPPGVCLIGVHGRANGALEEADFEPIRRAKLEAVKLLTWARSEDIDRLRQINPGLFILARLFTKIGAPDQKAAFFVGEVMDGMARFYGKGIRYFEIHNEPNLLIEGWTRSWANGREFNQFFLEVRDRLKQSFPDALFGYPGLSPNGIPYANRYDDIQFLEESEAAAHTADWIGVHCYWTNETEMNAPAGGKYYLEYRRRFPDKLLFITEFSNPGDRQDRRTKARQYVRYYQSLRHVPGLGAAFSFVLSASGDFPNEVWRDENGAMSEIPEVIGARTM